MKSTLPWILALLLAGVTAFLFHGNADVRREVAALGAQAQKIEDDRADIEALKQSEVDPEEMSRLRKENAELFRFRNQVSLLRREKAQLLLILNPAKTQPVNETTGRPVLDPNAAHALVTCVNQLQLIEDAKRKWSFETAQLAGSVVTTNDLRRFFTNNIFPSCPGGGVYQVNPIGVVPTCSVADHTLALYKN